MGRGLSGSQADYASLDAAIVVEAQRTAEASSLVVGMSGDAHQAKHEFIVA